MDLNLSPQLRRYQKIQQRIWELIKENKYKSEFIYQMVAEEFGKKWECEYTAGTIRQIRYYDLEKMAKEELINSKKTA